MSKMVELERLAHPNAATEHLGQRLFEGSLALLLGAGVSQPLGLPGFRALLDSCLAALGEGPFEGEDLELGATRLQTACIEKSQDIRIVVKKRLYSDPGGLPSAKLMGNKRLGALGAMLMGSRRGSVNTVLTFNFDSVLAGCGVRRAKPAWSRE
jgi:hypothetical protein